MEILLFGLIAFLVAGLTLFSGFGLGTLLMPAFALVLPVPLAVAVTAVVHLANNLFKLALVGRQADRRAVLLFGLPAALAALAGALVLGLLDALPALWSYQLGAYEFSVMPVKGVIGLLIIGFAALELIPVSEHTDVPARYLPLGGLLSGFFGGLSGNQGALRSAFLVRLGLSKEAFVATSVVSAVIVDTVRLTVYGAAYYLEAWSALHWQVAGLLAGAVVGALAGSYAGTRLLRIVTLRAVRGIVAVMLGGIGIGLLAGWL